MSYTIKNLSEVDDAAAKAGFSDKQEARFPRDDLDAEATGLAYLVVRPDERQPFAHRHKTAEEVMVVLRGGGRVKLDDEVIDVGPLDAIRVAPEVTRCFEAGPDGLEYLVFGPHHEGDSELVEGFWKD